MRRILSLLLAIVMVLGAVPTIAMAADTDMGVELGTSTDGTFVDHTADPDKSYEYTIVGSDGTVQQLTVAAAPDGQTENKVTVETIDHTYYQKVTDVNAVQKGTYLLVSTGNYALNTGLKAEAVATQNDRINEEHPNAEWTVTPNGDSVAFSCSKGNLNIQQESGWISYSYTPVVATGNSPFTLADQNDGPMMLYRTYIERRGQTADVYLVVDQRGASAKKNGGTNFFLYEKHPAGTDYRVDTTGLNSLIAQYEAENLVAESYTQSSWNAYQTALKSAQALQNPAEVYKTQEEANQKLAEVNQAQEALKAAHDALQPAIVTTPTISWTRTKDDTGNAVHLQEFCNFNGKYTYNGIDYDRYTALTWDWKAIEKLVNDQEKKQKDVWNYNNTLGISAAQINTGAGDGWKEAYVHKISGEFVWPEDYDLNQTTIVLESVNDAKYQEIYDYIDASGLSKYFPNGKVLPVNDDVYVVMWVENPDGTGKPTVNNINDYLTFWTGTSGKGIWSKNGNQADDWARQEPSTFLAASKQGVRAFYGSKPNAIGVDPNAGGNGNVEDLNKMDPAYLAQSDSWYTLTDTTAINSVMRSNYDSIPAGAKVHLDLYVHNNSSDGGIDELKIKLEKQPETQKDVTVRYYYGNVADTQSSNYLGQAILTGYGVDDQIDLLNGTNAGQLNYMKAAAVSKAQQTVSDGKQVGGTYTVVEGDNVINVVYEITGTNNMVYTYDFGTTNVYSNVFDAATLRDYDIVLQTSAPALHYADNQITFTPESAAREYTSGVFELTLKSQPDTVIRKNVYMIAASNVLYEENFISVKGPVAAGDVKWSKTNHTPYTVSDNDTTVYGYTEEYNASTGANGQYSASVTSQNAFTEALQFSFKGTGFDLIAACGAETGTLMVRVDDSNGKLVKAYVVDTRLKDASVADKIYQVPVVHHQGMKDGVYTVTVSGAYLNNGAATAVMSTYASNGGNAATLYDMMDRMGLTDEQIDDVEFINMDQSGVATYSADSAIASAAAPATQTVEVDGFRVYGPTDHVKYAENEKNRIYTNVMADTITGSFSAYVEGDGNGTFDVTTYEAQGGPQNELYLKPGTGIAFRLDGTSPYAQVSLRAVGGATELNNGTPITHNTEMYYEVPVENSLVVISNTGKDLLAIGNLKTSENILAFNEATQQQAVQAVSMMFCSPEPEIISGFEVRFELNNENLTWADGTPATAAQTFILEPDSDGVTAPKIITQDGEVVDHWEAVEVAATLNCDTVLTHQYLEENFAWANEERVVTFRPVIKETEDKEETEEEPFVPEHLDVKLKVRKGYLAQYVRVTVEASSDVSYLLVNGKKVEPSNAALVKFGFAPYYKFWTYQTLGRNEEAAIEIVAYNHSGEASEVIIAK